MKKSNGAWSQICRSQCTSIQGISKKTRNRRLATALKSANEIVLKLASCVPDTMPIGDALGKFDGTPLLVFRSKAEKELAGILTSFDLL